MLTLTLIVSIAYTNIDTVIHRYGVLQGLQLPPGTDL